MKKKIMRPSPSPTTNASHSRAQRQTVLSGRRPVSSARGIKLQLFAQKQRGNLLVALVPALVLACLGCSGAVPSIPNYSTAATLVAGEGTAAFVRTPSVFRRTPAASKWQLEGFRSSTRVRVKKLLFSGAKNEGTGSKLRTGTRKSSCTARYAVVEDEASPAPGSDSTVHRKRQRPKGYKEPGKRGVSSKHESPHTESAPMSDETLWNGLGYWEGLGEGLSGALLYAQQGLEVFNMDAFWYNVGQIDAPELPDLSQLRVFGLSWPTDEVSRAEADETSVKEADGLDALPAAGSATAASTTIELTGAGEKKATGAKAAVVTGSRDANDALPTTRRRWHPKGWFSRGWSSASTAAAPTPAEEFEQCRASKLDDKSRADEFSGDQTEGTRSDGTSTFHPNDSVNREGVKRWRSMRSFLTSLRLTIFRGASGHGGSGGDGDQSRHQDTSLNIEGPNVMTAGNKANMGVPAHVADAGDRLRMGIGVVSKKTGGKRMWPPSLLLHRVDDLLVDRKGDGVSGAVPPAKRSWRWLSSPGAIPAADAIVTPLNAVSQIAPAAASSHSSPENRREEQKRHPQRKLLSATIPVQSSTSIFSGEDDISVSHDESAWPASLLQTAQWVREQQPWQANRKQFKEDKHATSFSTGDERDADRGQHASRLAKERPSRLSGTGSGLLAGGAPRPAHTEEDGKHDSPRNDWIAASKEKEEGVEDAEKRGAEKAPTDANSGEDGLREVADDARNASVSTAFFIPKSAPPPTAWRILSNKPPTSQEESVAHSAGEPAESPSSHEMGRTAAANNAAGEIDELEDDGHNEGDIGGGPEDDDAQEFHTFGDVELSVSRIAPPPEMEITVNRRSGTPAQATARPVAAVAAKAAVESENALEEWVDGDPVRTQEGSQEDYQARIMAAARQLPTPPADLVGLTGEMRLIEMACLTGLSSSAGKSAGLIMHEELGFGHLLRGLRDDVRPSLRRRVLQAIATVVENDPTLAPYLLGVDDVRDNDHHHGKPKSGEQQLREQRKEEGLNGSDKGSGRIGGEVGRRLRGAARRHRRRQKRSAATGDGPLVTEGVDGSYGGMDDVLVDRITAILGIHGGAGFGVSSKSSSSSNSGGNGFGSGSAGPVGRIVRALVDAIPLPGIRPSSTLPPPSASAASGATDAPTTVASYSSSPPMVDATTSVVPMSAAVAGFVKTAMVFICKPVAACANLAYTSSGPAGRDGYSMRQSGAAAAEAASNSAKRVPDIGPAQEGRDWWKDDVALEEECLEQQAATLAAVGGWSWWWDRGRVSRERLVEEALELILGLLMSGDVALDALRASEPMVAALRRVSEGSGQRLQYDEEGVLRRVGPPLTHSQLLSNKILAAFGQRKWVPKTLGQKGVRILCFDGGGTRGVLTLALLKHVEKALGGRQPHEVFDMIVGTSTGGIIAGLAGVEALPVSECERMYDSLISKIFIRHPTGGMKLALKQAFYDEVGWMNILTTILGNQLMLDSAEDPLRPLITCPSSLISSNPSRVMLWRNYNYPSGHESRYYGSFRHMVRQAIRATTAAPTFFAPLMINGALYSDGALLCNNPSAVAFHEAKRVYPGVPVEMIVSIGTGCFFEEKKKFMTPSVGWDGIINQVISSATETEITTDIVSDLLPPDQFFRFNPRMKDMAIDEVRQDKLDWLKVLADEYFEDPGNQERLQEMAKKMRPPS